jgi:hypothetical protein
MVSARSSTRTFIAYATEVRRSAFEDPRGEQWQGIFTRCLLTILRRSPGGIEARALKDQLECAVGEHLTGQQAQIVNGLLDGATFGRRGVLPRLRVMFRSRGERVELFDGNGALVAAIIATAEPWVIAMKAGLYKLVGDAAQDVIFDHGRTEVTDVEF